MVKSALAPILALFIAAPAHAERYLWTLSASATDPFQNTAAPTPGLPFQLHLWLACSTEGMAAAAFLLETSAGLLTLYFTPCCGFLNVGAPGECYLFAVGGCPSGPIRAGWFTVFDPVGIGGRVCMIDCPTTGTNATVDCDIPPVSYPNAWIGFASDGMPPCSSGSCGPIAVEANSWGRIKGTYR